MFKKTFSRKNENSDFFDHLEKNLIKFQIFSFKILKGLTAMLMTISLRILKEIFKKLKIFTKILKIQPKTNYYGLDSRFYHLNQLSEGSGPL